MSTHQTAHVEAIDPEEQPHAESRSVLFSFTSATPWWIVSTLLHVLIIVLAALVSMSFTPPSSNEEATITVTELAQAPALNLPDKPKIDTGKVLDRDTDPTAEPGTDASNITVPPNVDLHYGDHWETNNPDVEDTHSARGNPDAHIFDRPHGDISDPGGGGNLGLSFDDSIGVGAPGSKGSGGGFGGGIGTGDGTDKGSGTGTFGRPNGGGRLWMAKKHGGSQFTENAVEAALRWLAYHQEPDGHWDTVKYTSGQKTDTAMTGMALLAFCGAGHTEKVGKYADTVRRAVSWLKSKQQPSGLIYDSTDAGNHRGIGYPHAIATLAMVEAAGMGRNPETKAAAQRAIDYATEQHQQGEGSDRLGWRYHPKEAGDLSVTGWFVMAMKSAKIAGLHVNASAFEGAIKFLASVEYKDNGGDSGYGGTSHFGYKPGDEHAGSGFRLTAIGSLVRQYCGRPKDETQGSVNWFIAKGGVPSWGANGEAVDLYYWYYGSMACFQQGGDAWTQWNTAMVKTLVDNQCKDGGDAGSWPVVGTYCDEWGRVGQTALGALNLEVYYRYERLKNEK
jgi:hypothetical protein